MSFEFELRKLFLLTYENCIDYPYLGWDWCRLCMPYTLSTIQIHPTILTNIFGNLDKYILLTYIIYIGKLPILMIVHISWFRLQPVCVLCTLSSSYNTPEGLEPQHSILRGTLESETYKHTYKYIQTYLYTWNLDIWAMEDAWIFLWLPSSPHLQINIHHPIPISPHLYHHSATSIRDEHNRPNMSCRSSVVCFRAHITGFTLIIVVI